ncbi:hypothetical protein GCM10009570_05500 [Dietzia natronolimnaea]|nr:hypothetical protein [Dietzia natronolimnaea]
MLVGAYGPDIRKLLAEYPTIPAPVIAERIAWPHSITVFKYRVRAIRAEHRGVNPADRTEHKPGDMPQSDLHLPDTPNRLVDSHDGAVGTGLRRPLKRRLRR